MKDTLKNIGDSILYRYDSEANTAIITITREKQLNALNSALINDLEAVLDVVEKKPQIRSVIITGSGDKAFVAGADIKEFQHFSESEAYLLSQKGKEKLFDKISNFPKPVIAAINGYAL